MKRRRKEKTVAATIRLPQHLHESLQASVDSTGLSMQKIMNILLEPGDMVLRHGSDGESQQAALLEGWKLEVRVEAARKQGVALVAAARAGKKVQP